MVITVACPDCATSFPVDTNKIPVGGVSARCSSCSTVFRIERPEVAAPLPPPVEQYVSVAMEPEPEPEPEPTFERYGDMAGAFSVDTVPLEQPTEVQPAVEDDAAWVFETQDDIDPDSLSIEPLETVESSVEEARVIADAADIPSFAEPVAVEPEPAPEPAPAPVVGGFTFGKRDPKDKASRLARVLVSDMISYNSERHARALANGTLKEDFEEEIQKSWREYVEQVGQEMADQNPFWVEALNDVLAGGQQIF